MVPETQTDKFPEGLAIFEDFFIILCLFRKTYAKLFIFSFQSKDSDNESDDDYVPYIPLKQRRKMEQSKMAKLGRARQLAKMEEKKASSSEAGSGDDTGPEVGPNANVSLLDQHSRLKVEAEGKIQGPIAVWNRCFIIPGPLRAVQFQYMYFVHRKLHGHKINPYRAGTELIRFNIVNIMVADALAPCVTRTSAPMILTI